MKQLIHLLCTFLIVCFGTKLGAQEQLSDTFEKPLADTAKKLAIELQTRQAFAVRFDVIEARNAPKGSLPNSIREIVGSEFKAAGITVVDSSAANVIEAKVEVSVPRDEAAGVTLTITFTLFDGNTGQEKLVFPDKCILRRASVISGASGLLVDASNKNDNTAPPIPPHQIKDLISGQTSNSPVVNHGVLRVHPEASFGMKVYVGGSAVSPVNDASGYPWITLQEGQEYTVELFNDSSFDCLVALTIDGVDSGWFSGYPAKKVLWVVRKHSTTTVEGWLTDSGGLKFEVSPPDESVAAGLGKIGEVGVIQASFFKAYPPGAPKDAGDRGNVGTKAGDPFEWAVHQVELERGKTPRAQIAIRYKK